ncbi:MULTISPECIES: hypothetical protein [unclassified Sinorhizobium]|uniref:hypothetical protein n=1 Tax=unclassified Sinorhizobium TaxID=2613772 RepID=UPI0024C2EDA5|nr:MULTISPECIES: hypothetical protein [unclassified Sinorhizobium]MDK1378218.1 hypothetical protein [Sinorhizobium sp. 6-70]MDK1482065.1 hypothetical protein [Sinorhizobium sp. 6-117]
MNGKIGFCSRTGLMPKAAKAWLSLRAAHIAKPDHICPATRVDLLNQTRRDFI